jgi:hypothetical protein
MRQVRALLRAAHFLAAWAVLVAAALAEEPPTMRLRIAWGGGEPRSWRGTISVVPGELSRLQPLGIEADEPGSMWIAGNNLHVQQRSPRGYDGVDVDVTAPAESTLRIELGPSDDQGEPRSIEFPLGRLVRELSTHELDESGNRLTVRRAPGDELQVRFERTSLVYRTGEDFSCEVTPRLAPAETAATPYYEFRLRDATTQRIWWTGEVETSPAALSEPASGANVSFKLPSVEGIYNLDIQLTVRRLPLALGRKTALAARTIQLIVLAEQPRVDVPGQAPASLVMEIDPAKPRWWERLTVVQGLPGMRKGSFGTGESANWTGLGELGPMVQLAAARSPSAPSWEAYPLAISRVGQAHIIEVEYPGHLPQTMAISVVEPNAAGMVAPIGLDSGFSVPDEAIGTAPRILTHRIPFWPKTRNPMLLVANLRGDAPAVYGKIRVLSYGGTLPRRFDREPAAGGRLLAGYYNRPLFAENFGASESYDAASGRSLDDWVTFYQGGTRLIEYLKYAGYDGVMLTVLADGSTIFPSERLQSTPRYDNGAFFSSGQDPMRKDVLEMLFRLFDREAMTLIPALSLASPLPELEEKKRQEDGVASGIELVGRDGTPWLSRHRSQRGLAPYYNPLNADVQAAILGVVDEVLTRYAEHSSFGGLALQLSADGYAQLPGLAWGFDDQTVAQFEAETGIKISAPETRRYAARAQALLGTHRKAWAQWRGARMADFHRRLSDRIQQARPGARLYLAGVGLFDSPELQMALRPSLPPRPIDEPLLEAGLEPELSTILPEVALLRARRIAPTTQLATRLMDLNVNESAEIDRRLRDVAGAGALFYHEPYKAPLPSFDEQSPFRGSRMWLVAQISPSEERNRQRFVHGIATLDAQAIFDGGWLLPLGQEGALGDLVSVYRRLPGGRWTTASVESQPVTIRTTIHNGQSYIYLANDSPWSVEVMLELEGQAATRLTELSGRRSLGQLKRLEGVTRWQLSLEPFDLFGATALASDLKVVKAEVTLPEGAQTELENRIQDFQGRAMALANQGPIEGFANGGFELPLNAQGGVPGWSVSDEEGIGVALDTQHKHSGAQSLKLSSTKPLALLVSDEVRVAATGRLEIAFWLRKADDGPQPRLRVAIEGAHRGEPFFRHVEVGAPVELTSNRSDWLQQVARFVDLPIDGTASLRVRFELLGGGEAWLDDVQLYHLRFSESERLELIKLGTSAKLKLQEGEVGDCLRLLDGYWPQFLMANVPRTEAPVAQRPVERQAQVPPRPAPPAERPGGIKNWLRQWAPSIWR